MFRHPLSMLGLIVLIFSLSACAEFAAGPFTKSDSDRPSIRASGIIRSESRPISGVSRLTFRAFGNVVITQGATESLTISTSDNLLPLIDTTVSGETLTISLNQPFNFSGGAEATFTLSVRELTTIVLDGVGNVQMQALEAPELTIRLNGAGTISLAGLASESLLVEHNGTGDITLSGRVVSQQATLRGAGNYLAGELRSETAQIAINGIGNATVWASGNLDATISGVGTLSYWGNPTITEERQGIGGIVKLGNR